MRSSNKLLSYNNHWSIYQKDLSGKAPNLEIIEHINDKNGYHQKEKTMDLAKLKSKYSLLVFINRAVAPAKKPCKDFKVILKI